MRSGWLRRAGPWVVLVVAAAPRLWYWAVAHDFPLFRFAAGDTMEYAREARLIAAGNLLGGDVYFHSSPLYPYFLAVFFKISPAANAGNLASIALVQLLMGVATAILLYFTVAKAAGEIAGVAAGSIYALSPIALFYDGELLMDFLLPLVTVAASLILAAPRITKAKAAVTGAVIAAGALARPNLLLLLIPAAFVLGWTKVERRPRIVWTNLLISLAAAVVVVAPITGRNYAVGRDFVLISSNGGVNLYIGNNPDANGTFKAPGPWPAHLEVSSKAFAERALGRRLKPSEVSAYFAKEALKFISHHPWEYFKKVGRRLRLLASAYEIPNHMDFNFYRGRFMPLKFLPFTWAIVWPWALAGAAGAWRCREARPVLLFAAIYLGSLATLFFVTGRYRFTAFPLLVALAVIGVKDLARAISIKKWKTTAFFGGVVVAGYAAAFWPVPAEVKVGEGYSYHHLGAVYSARGVYRAAARAYERAVEIDPRDSFSWNNLGVVRMRAGDLAAAEEALGRALALVPGDAEVLNNYASVMLLAGRRYEAEEYVAASLARNPRLPAALVNLAVLRLEAGDTAGARDALNRALAEDPRYAYAYFNLGLVCEAEGDYAGAAAAYREGLLYDPANAEARSRLAFLENALAQ